MLGDIVIPALEVAELGGQRVLEQQIFKGAECVIAQALLEFGDRIRETLVPEHEDLMPNVRHA